MADRPAGELGLTPAEREAIGHVWQGYGLEEHASVASFARFVLQMMQIGAPPALLDRAAEAMRDEVRHAQLCFSVASQYLASSQMPGPFAENICAAPPDDAPAILEATIRDACVAETLAVEFAREALAQANPGAIASVLNEIVTDESRHAELAWDFVEWVTTAIPELAEFSNRTFAAVFDAIAAADARDAKEEPNAAARLVPRGYGSITRGEERAIRQQVIDDVLRPRAHRLLAASRARAGAKTAHLLAGP